VEVVPRRVAVAQERIFRGPSAIKGPIWAFDQYHRAAAIVQRLVEVEAVRRFAARPRRGRIDVNRAESLAPTGKALQTGGGRTGRVSIVANELGDFALAFRQADEPVRGRLPSVPGGLAEIIGEIVIK